MTALGNIVNHRPPSSQRRRARVSCLRALYRSEVVGDDLAGLAKEISERLPPPAKEYVERVLQYFTEHDQEIDKAIEEALNHWEFKRLAVIDRCVLRIGVVELLSESDVPTRVILDEAIEIAKHYGSSESGRFVNGVLDTIARDFRREDFL